MSDPGFQRWMPDNSHDTGFIRWMPDNSHDVGFSPTPGGLLDGVPDSNSGSSLFLFMGPKDIATIPGLPQHVYDEAAKYDQTQNTGGVADQHMAAAVTNGQPNEQVALGAQTPTPSQTDGPKSPIGPVKGYPETGKDAWRAANDDAIVSAVDKFNSQHQYFPGDMGYMTPELMKSWMMRESGGSPEAFKTDPFQVNKPNDWPKDNMKSRVAGLTKGQQMTPEISAEAALKWLHYKGRIDDNKNWVPYQGHYNALKNYNAAVTVSGIPRGADYANAVMNNAWASYGDWQQ